MVRVKSAELYRIDLKTRIPFRYGIATMTEVPEVFLRVQGEFDGVTAMGVSSDCLPPKWFTKVAEKGLEEEVEEMSGVIRNALELAGSIKERAVFSFWYRLYEEQERWAQSRHIPPLLAHFGTSLVERALIDGFCRTRKVSFWGAVKENLFRMDFGVIHPELKGREAKEFLGSARGSGGIPRAEDFVPQVAARLPLQRVKVRHTVGLADAILEKDVHERLEDGLPESLEGSIGRYGLTHFKIKLSGKATEDVERLCKIAELLQSRSPEFRFSLDGNEVFRSFGEFREYWAVVTAEPKLQGFFKRLLFLEQPLHRDVALSAEVETQLKGWEGRPAIIIDESDGTLDAVAMALRLGYAGASHKNCKGVFKGIANRCLLNERKGLMTGEDLCNIGPVALLQDLAVMAVLGIESVERNGHHYHRGLSQFPKAIQEQVLANHGDLYEKAPQGWPTLRIEDGTVAVGSINAAPFGVGFDLDVSRLQRVQ